MKKQIALDTLPTSKNQVADRYIKNKYLSRNGDMCL